jgi:MFS family permease
MTRVVTETGPPHGGSSAMTLLSANRAFRSLAISRVVSFVGDTLSLVALMLHVSATAGTALAVSALLLVGDFGPALLSPVTGAIADRFDRKRVMIACELVQGALLVLIATTLPALPLLLVLVGIRATVGQTFQPASRAVIPALVGEPDLAAANSMLGFGTNGAEVLGPFLAAALFGLLGVRGILLVDAASFLVSAVLLTALPALPPVPSEAGPSFVDSMRVGLREMWAVPAVRVIVLAFCAVVACNGVDDVALVYLVRDTLHAPQSSLGWLLGGVGAGLLIGYLLLARLSRRTPLIPLLLLGFAVTSLGNLLTGLAWAVGAAFALQTVRGLGIAGMDVASQTLLQRLVPPHALGRVFGNFGGLVGVAAALSYVGGGLLLSATSAPVTLVLAGTGGLTAAVIAAIALRR